MGTMIYLLGKTVYTYIAIPQIVEIVRAPPIAPLIPYFPQLFGMESLFPPFYFTYFLAALAIVAIVHEFSHGIFMRLFKIKIKSTGLVFLGPILGAFVEEDKNNSTKKKNVEQMSVLAAGTFANLIFAILFFLLYIGFFYLCFTPAGYIFDSYPTSIIPASEITIVKNNSLVEIEYANKTYFLDEKLQKQLDSVDVEYIYAYQDAPAVRAELKGTIVEMNGVKIKNREDLQKYLLSTEPGDYVKLTTLVGEEQKSFDLTLSEHPSGFSYGYLGIGNSVVNPSGVFQKFSLWLVSFKDRSTYYAPNFDGELVTFFYNLLWWIAIINILVALFNMLPLGILDGGRFLQLAVLSVTKSKKLSEKIFRWMTLLILGLFFVMMMMWLIRIF
jgi:membrane-associated protease RseP (regulator of RpoE activity)